jgi:hypothetical protein
MLAGSLVVSHVTSRSATWATLLLLLSIHLWTNYRAVRAVRMRTLNRQRANIVFSSYIQSLRDGRSYEEVRKFWPKTGQLVVRENMKYKLPSPKEVSIKERIFERDGVMRWHGSIIMGHCALGVPLKDILDNILPSAQHPMTGSYSSISPEGKKKDINEEADDEMNIEILLAVFKDENYILSYSFDQPQSPKSRRPRFLIVLKESADTVTQAKSWFHAFLCARKLYTSTEYLQRPIISVLKETLEEVCDCWLHVRDSLQEAKWDLYTGALETRSGLRVKIDSALQKR